MAKKRESSAKQYGVGDRVGWDSSGGASTGKVVKVVTRGGKIKNSHYRASNDSPRYIVETDEGKRAAHRAEALRSEEPSE